MSANTLRTKRPKIAILGSDLCPNMPGSCCAQQEYFRTNFLHISIRTSLRTRVRITGCRSKVYYTMLHNFNRSATSALYPSVYHQRIPTLYMHRRWSCCPILLVILRCSTKCAGHRYTPCCGLNFQYALSEPDCAGWTAVS